MSDDLHLEINGGRTDFEPGETLSGIASWSLEKQPKLAELRLFWSTSGKGTTDVGVAETIRFDDPKQRDAQSYELTLPSGPCSYDGQLISLAWGLELVIKPGRGVERIDLTVKPGNNR